MNIYRITVRINGKTIKFLSKAESGSKALSEWLISSSDALLYSQDLIHKLKNIINNSVKYDSEVGFRYESKVITIECIITMKIDQDSLYYNYSDAEIFIYQHLSENMKLYLTTEDVANILELEFQYLEENNFIDVDPEIIAQEPPPILDEEVLSAFIQKRAMDEGISYSIDQIYEVFEKELEYMKFIDIKDGIDLGPFP
ncbi:MAG: hypothetical protein ACM3O3_01655 [Syntrophothermus sp.]